MSRTETKGERKRTTTTKQNTSNSSYSVEKVTPQILSLGTKPFVIFTDALFGFVFLKGGLIDRKSNFYLYSFGHKEKVNLFVCLFCSKMRANK